MRLWDVYSGKDKGFEALLFALLAERTPQQSISHRRMPTRLEHRQFIASRPYKKWWMIQVEAVGYVGSVYLTRQREIGISIFRKHQGKGYGEKAVKEVMEKYPGKFLANISPNNEASKAFFGKLGFKHVQDTYVHE